MNSSPEILQIPDFRPQIRAAIENAPVRTLREDGSLEEQMIYDLPELRAMADDEVVSYKLSDAVAPNTVFVTDPTHYRTLYEQAQELVFPDKPADAIRQRAQESLDHESAHADRLLAANPEAEIRYQVQMVKRKADGVVKTGIAGNVSFAGHFRKIDAARSLVAPAEPSAADFAHFRALGYTSAEEVERRYWALEERKRKALGGLAAS
jgi:hypothetical protein